MRERERERYFKVLNVSKQLHIKPAGKGAKLIQHKNNQANKLLYPPTQSLSVPTNHDPANQPPIPEHDLLTTLPNKQNIIFLLKTTAKPIQRTILPNKQSISKHSEKNTPSHRLTLKMALPGHKSHVRHVERGQRAQVCLHALHVDKQVAERPIRRGLRSGDGTVYRRILNVAQR